MIISKLLREREASLKKAGWLMQSVPSNKHLNEKAIYTLAKKEYIGIIPRRNLYCRGSISCRF